MDSRTISNDTWIGRGWDRAMTYIIMLILWDCFNRFDARDAGRNKVVEVVCGENSAHGLALRDVKT
jgi:hypothetical protein